MLKIGIVGWGYWGPNYAKYLNGSTDGVLEWVCDLREEALIDAKKKYPNLKTTKKIADLVKNNLDAVIIATPAVTHFKLAKFFIENKIDLLIEKPLTNSYKDACELLNLSNKYKTKVLVGHTFLYNSSISWLKNKIDKNFFGKVYYLEFKRQSYGPIRNDVNIIWDFAPHDLTIASYFLGNIDPIKIFAKGKRFTKNKQEDIAIITLEYPNKTLVNINVAWLYPIKIRTVTILGKKRMAIFEDTNSLEPIKIYNTSVHFPSEKDSFFAAFRLGDTIIPRLPLKDPLGNQILHFINYLKGKEKPITPLEDGLRNVKLLEAINQSLKLNKEILFK